MRQLDPKDIELIIALSREFSITATGQRLGVTTAAVSQRLTRIEEKIGATLASRDGRVILTQAGHEVLNYCLQYQQNTMSLERTLQRLKEPSIFLAADLSLLLNDVPRAIEQLLIDLPNAKVTLKNADFSDIIRFVIDGIADIGIIAGDPRVEGLRLLPYRKERVCLLMSTSHPLSRYKEVPASSALMYPLIQVNTLEHITPILSAMAEELKITTSAPVTVDSFTLQARFAAQTNIGLAITLETEAQQYVKNYPVKIVQLIDEWADNQLYFCTREVGTLNDAAINLMKLIAASKK